jgi:hypothetical protein
MSTKKRKTKKRKTKHADLLRDRKGRWLKVR